MQSRANSTLLWLMVFTLFCNVVRTSLTFSTVSTLVGIVNFAEQRCSTITMLLLH